MVDLAFPIQNNKASKFDPHNVKDKYEAGLKALVKRKAAGETIEVSQGKDRRKQRHSEESNVIDLTDAVKQRVGPQKSRDADVGGPQP
jgi:DNA end-binding protein Ku